MFSLKAGGRRVDLRQLRRGVFLVLSDTSSRQAKSPHEASTFARDALGIVQGAVDSVAVAVDCDGGRAKIWRDSGVTGFRLAVSVGEVSYTAGAPTFEDAVEMVLHNAPPWPENVQRRDSPLVIDGRFSFSEFAADSDPATRAAELGEVLTRYLNEAGSPADSFRQAMDALRTIGHDLWRWDTDGDTSIWGDGSKHPRAGLTISVSYSPFEPSTVDVEFKKRGD